MSSEPNISAEMPLLQQWLCSRALKLPPTPDKLMSEMRAYLLHAKHRRKITNSRDDIIHKLLKKSDPVDLELFERLKLDPDEHPPEQVVSIIGGQKDYKDDAQIPQFLRDDGARFNFSLTLHVPPQEDMILLAYDFDIRLANIATLSFVRFDLNPPSNRRKDKMRCHLHLNQNDDGLSVPAPLMHPLELLELFIYDFRQGKVRQN
ncbi:hypothetical protein [Haliangium sp. UPWRP_2]|uniref:hypothetical protein n=1 Tax=Haliangium sp. UPWRP_2 TaxID=1931276 RepID=UPI000B53BB7A|nr:hypothetical protein [Haliangium sp. UPWRP_2]PSM31820.1 hypothetical protein BVG81_003440 [Haliangium sp. UPWRP_2]